MTPKIAFFRLSPFAFRRSPFAFRLSLFFSVCFLSHASFAQTKACGFAASATDKAQYQAVMSRFNNPSSPQPILLPIPFNASIPIYFWVNKENPNSVPSINDLTKHVERINAYFHFPNNAHFTFCGMSNMNDPRFYTLPDTTPGRMALMYATYYNPNAINVYLPQIAATDVALGPNGARIILKDIGVYPKPNPNPDEEKQRVIRDVLFAHELGHVFKLIHTFTDQNSPTPNLNEIVIRTASSTKPFVPNWDDAADRMKSTAADIYGCKDLDCPYLCTLRDANNDLYTPDILNIMTYHFCTKDDAYIFTSEQQNKMNDALATLPHLNSLLNAPCIGTVFSKGNIRRARDLECIPDDYGPIPVNANVTIKNSVNGSAVCAPTLSNGFFGTYQSCALPPNSSITITPTKNTRYTEGVSTIDIFLISQHLLGNRPFTTPFQFLAADVDNNGDVDATDMLFIRRLLLNIITVFPNNVGSWRFVPRYFYDQPAFESAFNSNPFTASSGGFSYNTGSSYMDKVTLNLANANGQTTSAWSFLPFKVGDVNYCSQEYNPALAAPAPVNFAASLSTARVANTMYRMSTQRPMSLRKSEDKTIVLKAKSAASVSALQLGLRFLSDKFKIKEIEKGEFNTDNDVFDFSMEDKGAMRALWFNKRGQVKNLKIGTILLKAKVKANADIDDLLAVLNMDDLVLKTEFYDAKGNLVPIELEWEEEGTSPAVDNAVTVNAYPNPFSNQVNLEINSPTAELATITISNIITRESIVMTKQLTTGLNLINVNNTAQLSAGMLTYSVVVGRQIINGTITKAR
jgi:hypothetical protein